MQKVLLAVDGIKPTEKVFRYAVELCQRLRAELRVVQVIRPGRYRQYLRKVRKGASRARRFVENSMMAATFAEAGEYEMATQLMAQARKNMQELFPESERAGIPCHMTMRSGCPGEEIVRYVNENRNVVLTIYDTAAKENSEAGILAEEGDNPIDIKEHLSIPLVVIRSEG
jgi:nucleotide-binding universal stress UspA family protein